MSIFQRKNLRITDALKGRIAAVDRTWHESDAILPKTENAPSDPWSEPSKPITR